uniref:OCEL domain-containing protein n=1 Tax=Neogobius melanostomus TaxID=47308 RepID=A0A8C6SZ40_9GOBI
FNDQYPEYRDLHRDISLTLSKFRQLDAMMERLQRDNGTQNQQRIRSILQKLEEKKNDPTFWEKKERCDYLKAKLTHLKTRICTFDETNMRKDPH